MIFNVNGTDVEIIGYDDYLHDYESVLKDEYKENGEAHLINALENFDIRHDTCVCVNVESECVKNNREAKFYFYLGLGYVEYDCVTCINPETGDYLGYKLTTLWEDGGYICWSANKMYDRLEYDKKTKESAVDFLKWSEKAEVGEIFQIGRAIIEVIEGNV